LDGHSMNETAKSIIKPNSHLTSFERLEIYNRQYWFRVISSLGDDFDGLLAILGEKQFQKLVVAYMNDCPSTSFTLRNLGSKLENWLAGHLDYVKDMEGLSLDMVKLQWAEVEAFDAEALPKVSTEDLSQLGDDPSLQLQPYLRLLELRYPVHDFLLGIRERKSTRRVSTRFLPKSQMTHIVVHRLDNSVVFEQVDTQAFAILIALQMGRAVSDALSVADWSGYNEEEISNKIHNYFARWASLGWFCQPS
ncbi:MAG TPA: putative DNA-binding domain-containing protein, partial [Terriglobales bacterium]|nr:putative DNA-binding domain-containing protein [Terriglobales bacterium]